MAISVTEPLNQALSRTGRMLFKPFDIGKWFTIGFCAWLAHLAEGGGANFNNFPTPGGGGGGGGGGAPGGGTDDAWITVKGFLIQHGWWIGLLILAAVALGVAIIWVRARGKLIFMEAVAYDRASVTEPWKRLRAPANSFFRFQLLLTVLGFVLTLAVAGAALLVALPDIRAERFGGAALGAIIGGGLLLLLGVIVFAVVQAIAEDFLIPLMYLRGYSIGPAWGEFRRSILAGNVGSIVLFYLMRIALGIGIGMVAMIATCLTCFLTLLPYLGTVILLPLFVFNRAYSLYFLRQFGYEYNVVVDHLPEPVGAFQVIMPGQQGQWPAPQTQWPAQQPPGPAPTNQWPPPPPPAGSPGSQP